MSSAAQAVAARADIVNLDARLLLAGERLHTYRRAGATDSAHVQAAVVDRLLDQRLVLMHLRGPIR